MNENIRIVQTSFIVQLYNLTYIKDMPGRILQCFAIF